MEDRLFFDPHQPFDVTERKLPHWNQNNKFYFVTFRLADAMPTEVMHDWARCVCFKGNSFAPVIGGDVDA